MLDNLTDRRFGRVVVLSQAASKGSCACWNCICDCGKKKIIRAACLRYGGTKSCGCLHSEVARTTQKRNRKTHGKSGTKVYLAWKQMRKRCYNVNDRNYVHYGNRGIVVCDRWLESFENFYEDMGEPPTPKHSIERKDNNGNYCPDNCKWGTQKEQTNNRRLTIRITLNGKTQSLTLWAEEYGLASKRVRWRFNAGWPIEEALGINTHINRGRKH